MAMIGIYWFAELSGVLSRMRFVFIIIHRLADVHALLQYEKSFQNILDMV